MSFEGFTNKEYHKPGAMIGVKELLFGLNWNQNLVGRQPGQFLKLTREGLFDIFNVATKTGAKILKEIIAYQARKIRSNSLDNKQKAVKDFFIRLAKSNNEETGDNPQFLERLKQGDFIEIDVSVQKSEKLFKRDESKYLLKSLQTGLHIPPLIIHGKGIVSNVCDFCQMFSRQ